MTKGRGPFAEISWFQVFASALAAVTAAWIASKLGIAGTLIGAALGSFVFTLSSAFYSKTLHHGRTLLIQTEHGKVIERQVETGEVSEALDEAEHVGGEVIGAEFVDDDKARLHWKTIFATTVIVLALAMAAITGYELITNQTLGGSSGTTIGGTLGHGPKHPPAAPIPTNNNTPSPTQPTDTATTIPTQPTATASTPTTPPTNSITPTVPPGTATPSATE